MCICMCTCICICRGVHLDEIIGMKSNDRNENGRFYLFLIIFRNENAILRLFWALDRNDWNDRNDRFYAPVTQPVQSSMNSSQVQM